jgi:hypothetical protein
VFERHLLKAGSGTSGNLASDADFVNSLWSLSGSFLFVEKGRQIRYTEHAQED